MRSILAETCIEVVGLKMDEIYRLWVKFAKVMQFLSIT